tara:strand:+ start:144 stop:1145 length:1002 start_codon:yes stop_codon:yes gene_type:complete
MDLKDISFIIPVYNRPDEIDELLSSFSCLEGDKDFEIVIIEDGSTKKCDYIVKRFSDLNISYHLKTNSGPGDSRNYGMKVAKGKYYIILDSDVILSVNYNKVLIENLINDYSDCFGGVDDSHQSFNNFQKAVSYSMTSFITTGHIRGGSKSKDFQPRSFNMGISREAFLKSKGFGNIHPGEDPDLSIRLKKLGFSTKLYRDLKVFHKRRVSISSFFKQVYKFGVARTILNNRYPSTKKIIYWFPFLFSFSFLISIFLFFLDINSVIMLMFIFYFIVVFIQSSLLNNPLVGLFSVLTTLIQFLGYGYGFLKSFILIYIFSNKKIESIFPQMFFK